MKLQPWQRSAIEHMVNACANQDGVLLFHYMGTGKTYTSLAAAAAFGLPMVVVLPKPLVSQWKNEYLKPLANVLPSSVRIVTYEQLPAWAARDEDVRGKTLIMDEAHNLSLWAKRASDVAATRLVFRKLVQFKKRLILTGTPIYEDLSDLALVVNTAAGTSVLPINEREFEREYYRRNWLQSITTGYMLPFFYKYLNIVTLLSSMTFTYTQVKNQGVFNKRTEPLFEIQQSVLDLTNKWVRLGEGITGIYKFISAPFNLLANPMLRIMRRLLPFMNQLESKNPELPKIIAKSTVVWSLFITQGLVRWQFFPEVEKYKYLDVARLEKEVARYINFFQFDPTSRDFPATREKVVKVPYTVYASALFIRYTISSMTPEDLVALGLLDTTQDVVFLAFDQKDKKRFLDIGRMIGNACPLAPNTALAYDAAAKHYALTAAAGPARSRGKRNQKPAFAEVPRKYEKLAARLKDRGQHKCVLYTNFSHAMKTVSAYLHSAGIPNKVMRNDDSEATVKALKQWAMRTNGSVIILDSRYSEGVSFKGMDEIHILEPCLTDSRLQQAKARIVRFGSHPPGSEVDVFYYVSTIDPVKQFGQSVRQWAKHRSTQFWTEMMADHKQSATPDAIVYQRNLYIHENTAQLVKTLTSGQTTVYGDGQACVRRSRKCVIADEIQDIKPCPPPK